MNEHIECSFDFGDQVDNCERFIKATDNLPCAPFERLGEHGEVAGTTSTLSLRHFAICCTLASELGGELISVSL